MRLSLKDRCCCTLHLAPLPETQVISRTDSQHKLCCSSWYGWWLGDDTQIGMSSNPALGGAYAIETHSMHAMLYSPESGLQVSSTSQSRSSGQKSSTPETIRGRTKRVCTPERPFARALGDVVLNRRSSIMISPFVGRRTESGKPGSNSNGQSRQRSVF